MTHVDQIHNSIRYNLRIIFDCTASDMTKIHGKKLRQTSLNPHKEYFILMESGNI